MVVVEEEVVLESEDDEELSESAEKEIRKVMKEGEKQDE